MTSCYVIISLLSGGMLLQTQDKESSLAKLLQYKHFKKAQRGYINTDTLISSLALV